MDLNPSEAPGIENQDDTDLELSPACSDFELDFASLNIEEMESRLEVNQPMPNVQVAYGVYSIYARAKGFKVRKGNTERFTDGSGVKAKDFLCACEGVKDEKRSVLNIPVYVKPTDRCMCKAKLRVARLKGQNWRVTSFKREHSHDMYPPDQTHLLKNSRNLSSEMMQCVESMVKCGIPVARVYEHLEHSSGGRANVGCTRKDIYNSRSRMRRESIIENGDAVQLIEHFMEMTNKEPYFYWNVERDENKRLVNLFFRDYRCSVDYQYFGDVLSVDTTYRTNKYNMMCCPFVGINNHSQNVMFGFAFISDETQESFEWLFRTFLKSMGGKQPETIFTDQCQAMMNAVEIVFPNSHHRLCHWHINQNAPSHFGSLNGDSDFKYLWYKCMLYCQDEEEFETTWKRMDDEYKISKINWFNLMYKLREKWATGFSNHKFSAGLKATSRSEGTNSALKKKFGGATSSLYDCVIAFEKVQESWRLDEREKDTRSHHGRLPVGNNPWLIQAAEIYTLEIFSLFQKEVSESMGFAIIEKQELYGTPTFALKSRGGSSRIIVVQVDIQNEFARCSCRKFETCGILCRHVLKVFDTVNLDYIPERYIKLRWTQTVKNRVSDMWKNDDNGSCSVASSMAFVHEFMRGTYDLATKAQSNKDARRILTKLLRSAKLELNTLFGSLTSKDLAAQENVPQLENVVILDPLQSAKGITDKHKRHWDVSGKKGKKKIDCSDKNFKGTKSRIQSSQEIPNALQPGFEFGSYLPQADFSSYSISVAKEPTSSQQPMYGHVQLSSSAMKPLPMPKHGVGGHSDVGVDDATNDSVKVYQQYRNILTGEEDVDCLILN